MTMTGLPQPADILTYLDGIGSAFKADWQTRGRNQTDEVGTVAVKAYSAFVSDAPLLPASIMAQQGLAMFAMDAQYDRHYTRLAQQVLLPLEQQIGNNLLGTWQYVVSGGCQTNLDAHLLRLNACHPGVPLAIGGTLTLTPVYSSGGALRACTSANCPYVVVTAVGTHDYDESVISATSSQVAISGSVNALQLALSGTVPATAPTKLRIYRTVYGGASTGPYYWDQDVLVTTAGGSAWPAVVATLVHSDAQLSTDRQPPKFMQCPAMPEEAFLFADGFSAPPTVTPGNAYTPGSVILVGSRMLSPSNVVMNPSLLSTGALGFLGLGNNQAIGATFDTPAGALATGAQLGISILGSGLTAGTVLQTNNAPLGLQGFAGAWGGGGTASFSIQARAIVALNGTRTLTISYTYYDVNHPGSNLQSATGLVANAAFAGSVTNETVTFTIPAGRLVQAVTAESATGTATTGTIVYEAQPARSL